MPKYGAQSVLCTSLHCNKMAFTPNILAALKEVLDSYRADFYILGLDSNVPGAEAAEFNHRLRASGFMVGVRPVPIQSKTISSNAGF